MTALTPAQVRDHARALIGEAAEACDDASIISDYLFDPWKLGDTPSMTEAEVTDLVEVIADAIRTARITVDWDEETGS